MRLPYLDSIRGIAALIVLTSHLHQVARDQTWVFDLDGFRLFNASGFAVSIFFVLSGLVLFLQFEGARTNYPAFIVRRAFRIAPACLVAVTISGLIYYFWSPIAVPALGAWFNDVSWPAGITFSDYLNHLHMNGSVSLLRPMWTLVHEWRVSIIFPVIALMAIYYPRVLCVVAGAGAVLLSGPLKWMVDSPFPLATYADTAFYSTFFAAGALVAANIAAIVEFLESRKILRFALLLICAYWVCVRRELGGIDDWLRHGIIGTGIIMFCISDPTARRLLSMKWPRYFGRISYSLFLVHIIWIGILFRVLDGANPLMISALVIIASVASADALHRFVEAPMNRIGRTLAKAIDGGPMILKFR